MPKIASTAVVADARAALTADVREAWSPRKIHTSAPEVETPDGSDADALPVAFIGLTSPVTFDSEAAGAGTLGPRMAWGITGRFEKPRGANLAAQKAAKADALLGLLTAQPGHYAGCVWLPQELTFEQSEDDSDAGRGYYELTIGIVLHG